MSTTELSGPALQEAQSQIKDLIGRYAMAADRRDAEALTALWHSDASYVAGGETHVGVEAVIAAATQPWSGPGRSWHFPANTVIEFSSSTAATSISAVAAIATDVEGEPMYFLGFYSDAFEQRDGEWRFSRREVDILHAGKA